MSLYAFLHVGSEFGVVCKVLKKDILQIILIVPSAFLVGVNISWFHNKVFKSDVWSTSNHENKVSIKIVMGKQEVFFFFFLENVCFVSCKVHIVAFEQG